MPDDITLTTESAVESVVIPDNTAVLEQIGEEVHALNTVLMSMLVVGGIIVSLLLARFVWRFVFKPVLRFIKLPI